MWGWKEIDRIFKSALERPTGAEREAFLDDACRGNDGLRREVESLLAHDDPEGFLRERVSQEAAPLLARREDMSGRPPGHYKIIWGTGNRLSRISKSRIRSAPRG